MAGAAIEITRAKTVAALPARGGRGGPGPMLPAHCPVDGIADKRTGADRKAYAIASRSSATMPYPAHAQYNGSGNMDDGANDSRKQ